MAYAAAHEMTGMKNEIDYVRLFMQKHLCDDQPAQSYMEMIKTIIVGEYKISHIKEKIESLRAEQHGSFKDTWGIAEYESDIHNRQKKISEQLKFVVFGLYDALAGSKMSDIFNHCLDEFFVQQIVQELTKRKNQHKTQQVKKCVQDLAEYAKKTHNATSNNPDVLAKILKENINDLKKFVDKYNLSPYDFFFTQIISESTTYDKENRIDQHMTLFGADRRTREMFSKAKELYDTELDNTIKFVQMLKIRYEMLVEFCDKFEFMVCPFYNYALNYSLFFTKATASNPFKEAQTKNGFDTYKKLAHANFALVWGLGHDHAKYPFDIVEPWHKIMHPEEQKTVKV